MDEVRVAVVTGGAKGIGAAIASRLARDGFAVAILDLDVEAGTRVATELARASAHACDVSSLESVRGAVADVIQRWGGIDVVVNNAGWDRVELFLDNDPALWQRRHRFAASRHPRTSLGRWRSSRRPERRS